jgi:hypothetical protein
LSDAEAIRTRIKKAFAEVGEYNPKTDYMGVDVLQKAVDTLTTMALVQTSDGKLVRAPSVPSPELARAFRTAGRTTTLEELHALGSALRRAKETIERASSNMYASTIAALADQGVMRWHLSKLAAQFGAYADAVQAATQTVSNPTPQRGRPQSLRAQVVAANIVTFYEEVFGGRIETARSTPGLLKLITRIFAAMDIPENPRRALAAARAAIVAMRHSKSGQPSAA